MPCGLEAVLCEPVITLVGFGFGFGFCNCPKPAGVWKLGKKLNSHQWLLLQLNQ